MPPNRNGMNRCQVFISHTGSSHLFPSLLGGSPRHKKVQTTLAARQKGLLMQCVKSFLLTDVASDVSLDSFAFACDAVGQGGPRWSVRKRTLQGGLRDGVDLIELDNGALSVDILPT